MLHRNVLVLVALTLTLALAPPRAEARCASGGLALVPLTPLERPVPRGLGIVLALTPTRDQTFHPPPGTVDVDGPVTVEPIAPGLFVVPLRGLAPGPHALRGLRQEPEEFDGPASPAQSGSSWGFRFTIGGAAAPAAPPAPEVDAVVVQHGTRRGPTTALARLRTPVPANVAAIVTSTASGPIAFARPSNPSQPTLVTLARCSAEPPGTRAPEVGEAVTLRYVDAYGQLSPPSTRVTVSGP